MPNTILLSIIGYIHLIRFHSTQIKLDNNEISNGDAILEANGKIMNNKEQTQLYMDYLSHKVGFLKYIISALFWVALYRLIF
jgi:hypothetical protein